MKRRLSIILFIFGILIGGISTLYRLLITSDIPVTYTIAEAITTQIMFIISTLFIVLASSLMKSNRERICVAILFTLIFSLNLFLFKMTFEAEYFNSSYAQLQMISILNAGFIAIFSFFLVVKERLIDKKWEQ